MLLLHVDALVFGALPALDEQQLVFVLGGEIVVVGQAAGLLADQRQNALLRQLADKGLAAAGLGLVADVQNEFFHNGTSDVFCYCSTLDGQVQIFLRQGRKKHLQTV